MLDKAMPEHLVRAAYEAWCGPGELCVWEWARCQGLERDEWFRHFRSLKDDGLISGVATGALVQLTSKGVLYAESAGLAAAELVAENQTIRASILERLAQIREDGGADEERGWEAVRRAVRCRLPEFRRNLLLLQDLGLVNQAGAELSITGEGLDTVRATREKKALEEQFARLRRLEDITPQQRGHELEKLLERLVQAEDWDAERDVRSEGEQQDLVIHREREYYLIECKWEKDPVQPRELREFRDRITARPGVRGLFFSMSGYTDAAKQDARDRLESCMVLLFGPGDIERLFAFECSFTEMLNHKFDAAMAQRKILWK